MMLILKPNSVFYFGISLLLIVSIFLIAAFGICWGAAGVAIAVPEVIFLLWTAVRYTLAVGKTITLQEDGCTITILFIRKKYLWSDFSVKCMQDCRNVHSYRQSFGKGVFFSVKQRKRPKWLAPTEYIMLWHPFSLMYPFSTFFVSFTIGDPRFPTPYFIEEEILLPTFRRWGVEIEGF